MSGPRNLVVFASIACACSSSSGAPATGDAAGGGDGDGDGDAPTSGTSCDFDGKTYAPGDVFFSRFTSQCCRCGGPDLACSASFCPASQPRWASVACPTPAPAACTSSTTPSGFCGTLGDACALGSTCLECDAPSSDAGVDGG